jgi:endonuclease-3
MIGKSKKPSQGTSRKIPPAKAFSETTRTAHIVRPSAGKLHAIAKEPVSPKAKNSEARNPLAMERIDAILNGLRRAYPNAIWPLTHRNAYELVIATALSAQTTDATVNKVTPELFDLFPSPKALADAPLPEIERIIHTTGFYRVKAKNIKGAAKMIVDRFHGKVPETIEELTQLPGVARKTANVVLGSWFGIPSGVVVDTHVLRLSLRLELTIATEPLKVEQDLMKILPQDRWIQFSQEIIHHGRQICFARKPQCADCTLEPLCNSGDKTWSSH